MSVVSYFNTDSNMAHPIKCFVTAFVSVKHIKCVEYVGLSLYFPDDQEQTEQEHSKPGTQDQEKAQSAEPSIQTPEGTGV